MKRLRRMRGLGIFFFLVSSIGWLSSQGILSSYIDIAQRENKQVDLLQLNLARQQARVQEAKTLWGPTLDLSANYLIAFGGREILFPVGDLFNPTNEALNQLLSAEEFPTDLENQSIQLTPNNFVDANITIAKPLINSTIKYNQRIQERLLALTSEDQKILASELKLNVTTAYLNHLKAIQGLKVIDQNLLLLDDLRKFNQKLVQYDKATKEVISDVDVQIDALRSQRLRVIEQAEITKILLNTLMNRDVTSNIEVDTTVIESNAWSDDTARRYSSDQIDRPELDRIEIAQQVNQLNQQRIDASRAPTVGVQGGVGIQTENFSFDGGGPLYTLGIGLTWNILDAGRRDRQIDGLVVESQILDLNRQLLEDQFLADVLIAREAVLSAAGQLEADASAVRSAQVSYDLTKTRYKNDRALLIELLQAQNRRSVAQLNGVLSKYDLYIAQASLERALGQ
ncbi:MAG: TolC family protein [Bacteroidota bacterium]